MPAPRYAAFASVIVIAGSMTRTDVALLFWGGNTRRRQETREIYFVCDLKPGSRRHVHPEQVAEILYRR